VSRERRVSWGAIVEKGITRRRQRYTDCYLAIQVAGILMQLLRGSCRKLLDCAAQMRAFKRSKSVKSVG
jgi:hypothetical protein